MRLLWGAGLTLTRFWRLLTGEEADKVQVEAAIKGPVEVLSSNSRERLNKIVAAVGLGDLAWFLPFRETTAPYRDVFNKDVAFRDPSGTAARVAGGPLGHYLSGLTSSALIIDSDMGFTGGTTTPAYAPKYAVKLTHGATSGYVGSVKVRLKVQGDVSQAAIKFSVYDDEGGAPGEPLMQVDELRISDGPDLTLTGLTDAAVYRDVLIPLDVGVGLTGTAPFWLVMEYENSTGIDASNYMQWQYGPDPSGIRAYHDGTQWTAITGESFHYTLIDEGVQVPEDVTLFCAVRVPPVAASEQMGLVSLQGPNITSSLDLHLREGAVSATARDETGTTFSEKHAVPLSSLHSWSIIALTFSKYDPSDKLAIYQNGRLLEGVTWQRSLASLRGTDARPKEIGFGGVGLPRLGGVLIGGMVERSQGRNWGILKGDIGAVLLARRKLSPAEIAEVSHLMLGGILDE